MKATILDLRRNPRKILEAIDRNETVSLSNRGREIAAIVPKIKKTNASCIRNSPAFGIWKDRADMKNPSDHVREMRKGRFGDF